MTYDDLLSALDALGEQQKADIEFLGGYCGSADPRLPRKACRHCLEMVPVRPDGRLVKHGRASGLLLKGFPIRWDCDGDWMLVDDQRRSG